MHNDRDVSTRGPGFGVYVHWPFCESKCPYCDFNSHVADHVDHDRWRRAYAAEIAHVAAGLGETQPVTSVFFGGGTPSTAEPETIHHIIETLRRHFRFESDTEITLEANPSSVEAGRFAAYRAAGVNRVSLGVQSLNDDALRFLGRHHNRREALRALEVAATVFERRSFDLIYARPGQDPDAWIEELGAALDLAAGHLSVYQLTIESGTPFARDKVPAADDDTGATMYEMTQRCLADAGMPAYEISNHAEPGQECRHNVTCWRGGAYLGIGPGAHGRVQRSGRWVAEHRIHGPQRWLDAIERVGHGTAKTIDLDPHDRATEIVMTSLRLSRGINESDMLKATGLRLSDVVDASAQDRLIEGSLLEAVPDGLRVTPDGALKLNSVIAMLLDG